MPPKASASPPQLGVRAVDARRIRLLASRRNGARRRAVSVRESAVRSVKPSHEPERSGSTLALVLSAVLATGCGNALYAIRANAAAKKLAEARAMGAERLATYEYFYAKEHLLKAQTEAAEADYGDALTLAEASEQYAEKAIRVTRAAQPGPRR